MSQIFTVFFNTQINSWFLLTTDVVQRKVMFSLMSVHRRKGFLSHDELGQAGKSSSQEGLARKEAPSLQTSSGSWDREVHLPSGLWDGDYPSSKEGIGTGHCGLCALEC